MDLSPTAPASAAHGVTEAISSGDAARPAADGYARECASSQRWDDRSERATACVLDEVFAELAPRPLSRIDPARWLRGFGQSPSKGTSRLVGAPRLHSRGREPRPERRAAAERRLPGRACMTSALALAAGGIEVVDIAATRLHTSARVPPPRPCNFSARSRSRSRGRLPCAGPTTSPRRVCGVHGAQLEALEQFPAARALDKGAVGGRPPE